MTCYTTIITTEAQKFLPPGFKRCNMSEVDHIKNVTIVGIGTQGSMIAFRNALYGKNVTGYSRSRRSTPARIRSTSGSLTSSKRGS